MIVEPSFPDHHRTRDLIRTLGDRGAGMYVLRIWGDCQENKRWRWPLKTNSLHSLCMASDDIEPAKLEAALIEGGFIARDGDDIVCEEWAKLNAQLIAAWTNGGKGGRPKLKPKVGPAPLFASAPEAPPPPPPPPKNPTGNPTVNPTVNPTETVGVSQEKPIGLDRTTPPYGAKAPAPLPGDAGLPPKPKSAAEELGIDLDTIDPVLAEKRAKKLRAEKRAAEVAQWEADFAATIPHYPKRPNTSPALSLKAYIARRGDGPKGGETFEHLLERTKVFAAWAEWKLANDNSFRRDLIMHAYTFFGASRRYNEDWEIPVERGTGSAWTGSKSAKSAARAALVNEITAAHHGDDHEHHTHAHGDTGVIDVQARRIG